MGKLEEAKKILKDLKLSKRQQNDRSAYTLLSLADLKRTDDWASATNNLIGIHGIIKFIGDNYELQYAENSRESFRRQTIHQFEHAGLIERNADNPTRPTNSGKTVYSLTLEALELVQHFGNKEWSNKLKNFLSSKDTLAKKYAKKRSIHQIPVKIGNETLKFSSGKHNKLQKLIIEEFGSRFAKDSKFLYVGDTAKKNLYMLEKELEELGISMAKHDKLPDIVLYDAEKNWLYLCEAVTSHGPVSPKRIVELEHMLSDCDCGNIYVSCFLDLKTYKKYADDIAWETEVWIGDMPNHMIHMNGDRFLGPR